MTRSAATFLVFAGSLYALSQAGDERLPEFEVASVKPIDPQVRSGIDIKVLPGGRMVVTAASFQQLVAGAYGGLQLYQVVGPAWIADTRFNIEAKPPENDFDQQPTVTALGRQVPRKTMLRLRSLLIARFNLRTHFETRDHMVYDLVVARNGPKLKEGVPKDPPGGFCGGYRISSIEAKSCSMSWLANLLARFAFQTDVFDKTGLTRVYDFQIAFAPTGAFAPVEPVGSDPSTAPSLFTAIQDLGLKLEARKAPMEMLVIDHAGKLSEN
jgi:uncharacterized protein (TIGR03435 family)